jgi:hypothetical protein
MIRVVLAFAGLFVASACSANAQSAEGLSRPVIGGVGVSAPSQPALIGASKGTDILRHRGPTGSPCLSVGGFARPHIVDPNLYDHVITVKNSCPQRIAMQVCYYNSHDCIPIEIPGGERKEAILGTLPSEKDFRFEFRERF